MVSQAPERGNAVLVTVGEPVLCRGITRLLGEAGFGVVSEPPDRVWNTLERRPDVQVVFADLDTLREAGGLALAHRLHERWPTVKLVLTSSRIRHLSPSAVPENGCFVPRPVPADLLLSEIAPAAPQELSAPVC